MKHNEDNEQITLFRWAQFLSGKYPELGLMFHIPNGGKRDVREAARFKSMGVKAGVPDIFLPLARGSYHGLFIELKAAGGKPSEKQKECIEFLKTQGYRVEICYGWENASKVITEYLESGNGENSVVHGHWIKTNLMFASSSSGRSGNVHICSVCGEQSGVGYKTPWCAICGAMMDSEERQNNE